MAKKARSKSVPKLQVIRVGSITEAINKAMDWIKPSDQEDFWWYRGVNDSKLELLPGAYWRKGYDEKRSLLDFVQEGRAYAHIGELDDWRTYYLAQHHGVPTRLLDWTESFLSALFFAIDGWNGKTVPCVWILRPGLLNKLSINWRGIVTPEQNKELEMWLPTKIRTGPKSIAHKEGGSYDSRLPIAIYPRKENARIVAQQGTFTVHGTEPLKLNEWIYQRHRNPKSILCRIDLTGLTREIALAQLSALGARRHTVYPDIDSYVGYLKQKHGW